MEKEALGLNGDERLNVIGSIIEVIYESVEVMEVRRDATNIRAFVLIRVFFFCRKQIKCLQISSTNKEKPYVNHFDFTPPPQVPLIT